MFFNKVRPRPYLDIYCCPAMARLIFIAKPKLEYLNGLSVIGITVQHSSAPALFHSKSSYLLLFITLPFIPCVQGLKLTPDRCGWIMAVAGRRLVRHKAQFRPYLCACNY